MAASRAEYYREYRATKAEMKDNREQELFRRKMTACIEALRADVGHHAITGSQLAAIMERSMLDVESRAVAERREFIEALRGGNGQAK